MLILFLTVYLCTIFKEKDQLLVDLSSKKNSLIDELDKYLKLEDSLKYIIKYNNKLINQKSKIQMKTKLTYEYIRKCYYTEGKKNSDKKRLMDLFNLSKGYKSVFINEKDFWLTTHIFSELDHFIRDEDPNKKLESIKNTKKFMKKYNQSISILYDICSRVLTVYRYESYYGSDSKFSYSKTLLSEITKIVMPDFEVIKNTAIFYEILSKVSRSEKKNFFKLK
jgi:hypothetical protein